MKSVTMYEWVKRFATVGIMLAIFLLWEQFFHPGFQPCNVNSTINCDAIVSGSVSKILGVPTPLIGLTGYVVILVAAFKKWKRVILGMATFGLLFCLSIAYIELFKLHVVCPVCILCQIVMIFVFGLGIALNLKKSD